MTRLYIRDGSGEYRVAKQESIVSAAEEILHKRLVRNPFTSPDVARDYLRCKLRERKAECFVVMFLDSRNRLIETREMFHGTVDGASVHTREVVRAVLETNAVSVIFAHNHPSGVAEPSRADEIITRKLKESLALIDTRVLDHFIVGDNEVMSFAERGLL